MKRNIKICFVTPEFPPNTGGVSQSAYRISKFLSETGYEVHIFTSSLEEKEIKNERVKINANTSKIYRVSRSPNFYQNMYNSIKHADDILNFDLFHGFYFWIVIPCLYVAEKGDRPIIGSIRGIDGKMLGEEQNMELAEFVLQNTSWITSVSKDSLMLANRICDITNRASFLPNSINLEEYPKWDISEKNRGIIGTVSTFREKKNIPLLVQSYSQLNPGKRKKLLLVGDFIDFKRINVVRKTQFEELIKKNNIANEVEITGYIEHRRVKEFLPLMNVFVISSNHEGLPNALLEAAATGLPIVATAVDGIKDIMKDGKNGLLVPPDNPGLLTNAIESILSDDKLAKKLSSGALSLAKKLSPECEKKAWQNIYSKLLSNKKYVRNQ